MIRCVLFRVAALLLLFSVGVCLAQDISDSLLHKDNIAQDQSCPDNSPGGDCFCCCAHVLPVAIPHVEPEARFTFVETPAPRFIVDLPPARLLRPPRA
jgi:hypothetical protein